MLKIQIHLFHYSVQNQKAFYQDKHCQLKKQHLVIKRSWKNFILDWWQNNQKINRLKENLIFLSASFKGTKKNKEEIENEVLELKKKKDKAQPTKLKTSGSTFKNPIDQTDKKVWELIKDSVPLDISFGDAHISNKHCNFFVNKNNASFEDMNKLIEFVKTSVEKKTGIVLEKEIKILK